MYLVSGEKMISDFMNNENAQKILYFCLISYNKLASLDATLVGNYD